MNRVNKYFYFVLNFSEARDSTVELLLSNRTFPNGGDLRYLPECLYNSRQQETRCLLWESLFQNNAETDFILFHLFNVDICKQKITLPRTCGTRKIKSHIKIASDDKESHFLKYFLIHIETFHIIGRKERN